MEGKREEVSWLRIKKPRALQDELLDERKIMTMIDAAENLKDKALIAMLYEGGFRISELGSRR